MREPADGKLLRTHPITRKRIQRLLDYRRMTIS